MLICPQCGQTNPVVEVANPGLTRTKMKRVQQCRSCGADIVRPDTETKPVIPRVAKEPKSPPESKPTQSKHHGITALCLEEELGNVTTSDAEPIYPAMS